MLLLDLTSANLIICTFILFFYKSVKCILAYHNIAVEFVRNLVYVCKEF